LSGSEALKNYIWGKSPEFVEEVRKFLKIPSVSGTGEGIEETASYLKDWLYENLGVRATLLRYGGHPIVYGRVDVGSDKTVVMYNMYDVQPPEPLDEWVAPPFEARVVDGKIIARGAYNTKGALMSSLLGVKSLLDLRGDLPVNVAFVFEGEEEIGSVSMPKFVEDKGSELRGSTLAFFAIPSEDVPGRPVIVLGNKGIVFVELRCRVSRYDIHSSLSRGVVNPVAVLAKIASELIDPHLGPKLSWLEDKVITPTSEDLEFLGDIMEASPQEKDVEDYGITGLRLKGVDWYVSIFFKPTVNVDGIQAGYVGPGTKTIIPSEAVMRLDFRLVPNVEPEDVVEGLKKLIERLGLRDYVEVSIHDYYTWSKTPPKHPAVAKAVEAYAEMGMKPYIIPITPGSAPAYLFTRTLKIPTIDTGPGHGGRAHAPNEYITVDTVPKMALYTAILLTKTAELQPAKAG